MDILDLQGISIPRDSIYSFMQRCTKTKDLRAGRHIHSFLVKIALDSDTFWVDHLIRLYALCGSLLEANKVFSKVSKPSVYTWNAIMSAHAKHGKSEAAMDLYNNMKREGVTPDKVTFLIALKVTSTMGFLCQGRIIHDQIIRTGLALDISISNTLVDAYAKCKSPEDAGKVFETLPIRDVVSWTAMIAGYVQHGFELSALKMYDDMKREGIKPSRATFLSVLKACGSMERIEQGRLIHDEIIRSGLDMDIAIGNTLVDLFAKCKRLKEARKVFDKLEDQDAVSWGAMIAGYAMHGQGFSALELFEKMQHVNTQPSKDTLSCILKACLKACGSMLAIKQGRLLHDLIIKNELKSDIAVGSTLVDMYAKCGRLDEACRVFVELPSQDVVSWGAIIAGYAQHGQGLSALELYERMHNDGIKPSTFIFSSVVKACASSAAIAQGRHFHDQIVRHRLEMDVVIGNTLIDMYVKCGNVKEAHEVFEELPCKDEVSWGTIILGCAQHEYGCLALELLEQMQEQAIKPGKVTVLCILKACSTTESIQHGRWVHDQVMLTHVDTDPVVGNSLVDMYVNCGSIDEAGKVFETLSSPDLASWGAMIAGYAMHGNWKLARKYFEEMQHQGLIPDDMIFTSILTAYSHAGLLEEGQKYFRSMKEDYGITPSAEHCSCIVNLLSRAGCLTDAELFLQTVPREPEVMLWRSLLTSCRTYCNIVMGRRCFKEIARLDPSDASGYLLMSDIYADAQLWAEVYKMEELRKHAGAQKLPGQACIEMKNRVHKFKVGGQLHDESNDIFSKVNRLSRLIKGEGSVVPLLDLVESRGDESQELALFKPSNTDSITILASNFSPFSMFNDICNIERMSCSKEYLVCLSLWGLLLWILLWPAFLNNKVSICKSIKFKVGLLHYFIIERLT